MRPVAMEPTVSIPSEFEILEILACQLHHFWSVNLSGTLHRTRQRDCRALGKFQNDSLSKTETREKRQFVEF